MTTDQQTKIGFASEVGEREDSCAVAYPGFQHGRGRGAVGAEGVKCPLWEGSRKFVVFLVEDTVF